MNPLLLITVGILYIGVAAQYVLAGRPMMGLVFLGYALAQLGFILEAE